METQMGLRYSADSPGGYSLIREEPGHTHETHGWVTWAPPGNARHSRSVLAERWAEGTRFQREGLSSGGSLRRFWEHREDVGSSLAGPGHREAGLESWGKARLRSTKDSAELLPRAG